MRSVISALNISNSKKIRTIIDDNVPSVGGCFNYTVYGESSGFVGFEASITPGQYCIAVQGGIMLLTSRETESSIEGEGEKSRIRFKSQGKHAFAATCRRDELCYLAIRLSNYEDGGAWFFVLSYASVENETGFNSNGFNKNETEETILVVKAVAEVPLTTYFKLNKEESSYILKKNTSSFLYWRK